MTSNRNLVQCMIGYTEQFALDAEYRFEADKFGRHVAEVHDQRAKAFFLTNSAIYRAVPDEPEDGEAFVPAAPENPLPPQGQRDTPVDPDAPGEGVPSQAEPPQDAAPAPEPEPAAPAPATQAAPGIGDQSADDDAAGDANEPPVLDGTVAPADATDTPAAGATDAAQPITKESLEAMTKVEIIALAEKLDVVVVKRDSKAEVIEQLLAGLD